MKHLKVYGSAATIIWPKHYNCCVPSCKTRASISSLLNFPTNSTMRQKWICAIPDLDCVVDYRTLICSKHFKRTELVVGGNRATTVSEAVPSIFSKATDEIDRKKRYSPKHMFEIMERDFGPETFGDLEKIASEDFIFNFFYLKSMYKEKLGNLMCNWNVSFTENYAFFYLLALDHVAKIKCSIKINDKLLVQVVLSGRIMDPLDLTWIMPPTSKITRWGQLRMLLFEFGVPGTPSGSKQDEIVPDLFLTS